MALADLQRPQLLGEARQPEALLALKKELGAGGPRGWRPSRLILINYWLFDYEVFHFVQGRLLLRGANGSGKTTVLVSAITLVLDAEKRRERLDPFGGQGRGLAYYLVGDPEATPDSEFYFDNRTGYVALELEHARTGEHRTIGLGLRTSRSRVDQSVDLWGFVVTDGRRVGVDFDLIDPSGQPLAPRQLAELLGPGGRVVERASDYRELVNRYIFGFPQVEQYEFVLDLLHQLRSPKLNRDIKPSVLCELLTDSLPPLPSGLLDQVTRVIRDIDEGMESLEEARRQLQVVEDLNARYAAYLNQVAQLAAVDYQAALG
ncbi:MAG: AAA family ATPase, partial [Firmicutes bacterium]|nr:AAA family ATPase [Bacillota bacterium]